MQPRRGILTLLKAERMVDPRTLTVMNKLSDEEKEAVLIQLELILSSPHFKNSRRYTDFLRFVVQQTVEGHSDILKERTLGIEVFERNPNFDTAGDSIVRVAAAEVRKRLAQYYQEEGHEQQLRIDLPSGSYVARFRFRPVASSSDVTIPVAAPKPDQSVTADIGQGSLFARRGRQLTFIAAAFFFLAVTTIFGVLWIRSDNGMNRFWGPVFGSSAPVLVCVGTVEPSHLDLDRFTAQMANNVNAAQDSLITIPQFRNWPAVAWADVIEITRITKLLAKHDPTFLLRSSDSVTLSDLHNGPVVLVGLLENAWSLRLAAPLRFHPRMDFASQKMWIEDTQHPASKDWSYPWGVAYSQACDDYALITRTRNPLSGQITVEVGGLGLHASQAASEFVTNPAYLNALSHSLRDPNKNVQIVLRVNVINGESAPPHIVAEYYW